MSIFRAVLDTNVLVSALLSPTGNPAKVYRMFLAGTLELVISEEIFAEYEEVLRRPRLKITIEDADMVLDVIQRYGDMIRIVPSVGAMIDEDDRIFYDAAKSAGAYLITGNTKHFPKEFFVLTPSEFLEL